MTDAQWVKLLRTSLDAVGERRIQIKNTKMLTYLKAYYADLEYQFKQDGFEYMNSASCGTPAHETDERAEKYLADLADFITKEEEAA